MMDGGIIPCAVQPRDRACLYSTAAAAVPASVTAAVAASVTAAVAASVTAAVAVAAAVGARMTRIWRRCVETCRRQWRGEEEEGGVEADMLVSCARTTLLLLSRPPFYCYPGLPSIAQYDICIPAVFVRVFWLLCDVTGVLWW